MNRGKKKNETKRNNYDKNRNLISYDKIVTQQGPGLLQETTKFSVKCDFNYDDQNRMIKSKKINPPHFEELISITYDNEGNINDKKYARRTKIWEVQKV